ncbi:hypothetical protein E2P81_ATG09810 [Venturia nashicola]|uniref:Uncharacterized protein n=1 Tax=Venturia nashicola TaxID=86259 RepID=A0A4Z1NFB5_9PEZI|nr:hypothetical protein E6O75_ATG10027 [Venturia nashicola]TLD15330.1 hypothetical protein E2P81_ATG09810 [Venturia nashicola]
MSLLLTSLANIYGPSFWSMSIRRNSMGTHKDDIAHNESSGLYCHHITIGLVLMGKQASKLLRELAMFLGIDSYVQPSSLRGDGIVYSKVDIIYSKISMDAWWAFKNVLREDTLCTTVGSKPHHLQHERYRE